MKNLTTFLKLIKEVGHASIIQETSEEKVFQVLEMQIDEDGKLNIEAYYEDFKPSKVDIDGVEDLKKYQFSQRDDEVNYRVGIIPGYDEKSILANIIASNFSDKKSISISKNHERTEVNQDVLDYLYTISIKLLSISNHSLVCSHCTNDDYITKYLLKSEETSKEEFKEITIEDVEAEEEKLIERFNEVKTLGDTLSSKEISKEEFASASNKWTKLYEDRQVLSLKCR